MRKIFLTVAVLATFSMALAQSNCKFCGDWVGTILTDYPHNTKSNGNGDWRIGKVTYYIRINKYGEKYTIKIKHHFAEGDIGTVYNNDYEYYEVLDVTDTSIYFKATDEMSCNHDQYDRITGCSKLVLYFLVTYHSGYIHYQLTDVYALEYNKDIQYIGTTREDLSRWLKKFPEYNMDLYKEDNDW